MQLPRHCRVSPPAPTYTTTSSTQAGACTRQLTLSQQPARVHAHQATAEQWKNLVLLYLSLQGHVGFVIGIHLVSAQELQTAQDAKECNTNRILQIELNSHPNMDPWNWPNVKEGRSLIRVLKMYSQEGWCWCWMIDRQHAHFLCNFQNDALVGGFSYSLVHVNANG